MGRQRYLEERRVRKRLLLQGILEFTSPVHPGGNDPMSLTDQSVLRDYQGIPFIPGATLAGVLRSYINSLLGGDSEEHSDIVSLFGSRWSREEEPQSPLITDDAPMLESQQGITELRDGVKIDAETGTTEPKKKFDREFLPVGTRFQLRFELLLRGDETDEIRRKLFFTALHGLENGEISIGARIRRGHGRCKASDWTYQIFDVSGLEGMLQWLGNEGGVPKAWPESALQPSEKIQDIAGIFKVPILSSESVSKMTVKLSLCCPASLLIRSGGHDPDEADAIHLHRIHQKNTNLKTPVLSGTSLGGALRQRAQKIANTLAASPQNGKARKLVENLFGCEMEKEKEPWASKVWVDEAVIKGQPPLLRHARVHIDRWRGSSLEHMLFEEDALFGGNVTVQWRVFKPEDKEIGLMLCLIKDLFTGDLPLGGESSIGRGIVYGQKGEIDIYDDTDHKQIVLTGDGRGSLTVENGSAPTDRYFIALNNSLK